MVVLHIWALHVPGNNNPIGINDCTKISKHVSVLLDVEEIINNSYNLEISSPVIMSPFNKVGYQMNSSKEICESTIRNNPEVKFIAMSTLAAGYLKPREAYDYLFNEVDNIAGVVVGVSSKEHAEETFMELQKYIK